MSRAVRFHIGFRQKTGGLPLPLISWRAIDLKGQGIHLPEMAGV